MLRGARILLFLFFLAAAAAAAAQPCDLLIRNGFVVDPQTGRQDTLDLAIRDNRIVKIAKHIDPRKAKESLDARGMIVCPGLIDIHTHVFFGPGQGGETATGETAHGPDSAAGAEDNEYAGGSEALHPDSFSFRTGVTTVVDAGSSGWRNFETFKTRVIDHSKTRVLAFLNIVGAGMRGSPYEQDTTDMNSGPAAAVAQKYRQYVVGFKVAHYAGTSWHPIDAAVKAGTKADIPVMIDFGEHIPPMPLQELFENHLRPQDIFTHCFAQLEDREPIVDPQTGGLKPFVIQARKKGIVFDLGYGGISFVFSQAVPAVKAGFLPNSISTDLHNGASHDILDIMSQFLALGVDLPTLIRMTTLNPAQEIKRKDLGGLQQGAIADIAILSVQKGHFEFADHTGQKIAGKEKLECMWTIKDGKIVYRRSALSLRKISP
jgi:dihydroorotase